MTMKVQTIQEQLEFLALQEAAVETSRLFKPLRTIFDGWGTVKIPVVRRDNEAFTEDREARAHDVWDALRSRIQDEMYQRILKDKVQALLDAVDKVEEVKQQVEAVRAETGMS